MSLAGIFKKLWMHPLVKNLDVDSVDRLIRHRKMISAKPLLRAHLMSWYRELVPSYNKVKDLEGKVVEIGSGAGFLEEIIPEVVKTDIYPSPFTEEVQNAESLSYEDESLKCLYLVGVLHHLADPEAFFAEADRVLVPGGRLVMIEPNNTFPQKILCKVLDHYEYFDDSVFSWKCGNGRAMTKANLALPWIIFFRDRRIFCDKYPRLKIEGIRYHTLFLCLLSGGMTYRAFAPQIMIPLLRALEWGLRPWMHIFGTSFTVELVKSG